MIRVLWADDQQDVIKTLSGLLTPLNPRIVRVKSGIEALRMLKADYFDILILDLMMPPNTWGGLWLLEEIRSAQIRVPVIVLSGEGAQDETIKALRLGAKDYVTKDKVQEELVQRVHTILEDFTRETESYVTTCFPTPLAIPYRRYLNATAPVTQLRRLIEFYESALRLSCIIGICELWISPGEKSGPLQWISPLIRGPSMGTWNQIRHALARQLHQDTVFFSLQTSFDNKATDSMIQLRNDIAHGAEPSRRVAEKCLGDWRPQLHELISKLWRNLGVRIFLPLSLHFDGTEFQIQGHAVKGDSVALPKLTVTATKPIICDRPYLISEERGEGGWVSLFPFICVESAVEPDTWQVLIFDGLRVNRTAQALTGEEPICYIDPWSGQRNVIPASNPRSKMLPEFMTREVTQRRLA